MRARYLQVLAICACMGLLGQPAQTGQNAAMNHHQELQGVVVEKGGNWS